MGWCQWPGSHIAGLYEEVEGNGFIETVDNCKFLNM